jgi:hypothetical protein
MSNRASSLDPARARATLEAALAAAPGALDATQTALLWQFVDSLESSALPAMPIEANAWYCFELAAVVAAGETSPRLDITLGVRGQVVFRGSLAAGSSGQAVLSLVPFLIQAAAAPNAGSVTWIDNLRVHATPSIGCE